MGVEADGPAADFAAAKRSNPPPAMGGNDKTDQEMKTLLTSSTLWRFIGGFALGGLGVLALHPAGAQTAPQAPATVISAQG